jgi:hypothetical protein
MDEYIHKNNGEKNVINWLTQSPIRRRNKLYIGENHAF